MKLEEIFDYKKYPNVTATFNGIDSHIILLGVEGTDSDWNRLKNSIQQLLTEALREQRKVAGYMANDIQSIAMRYNTVVSTEAINIEIKKIFNKWFPEPSKELTGE